MAKGHGKLTGNPIGKPPLIITPEMLAETERLASLGLTQEQIASCLGIGRSTLFEQKHENPDFRDAISRGQAKGIAAVSNALYTNAIDEKSFQAQQLYLKSRAGWKETNVTEHQLTPHEQWLDLLK